jgi:hypothetical protein
MLTNYIGHIMLQVVVVSSGVLEDVYVYIYSNQGSFGM